MSASVLSGRYIAPKSRQIPTEQPQRVSAEADYQALFSARASAVADAGKARCLGIPASATRSCNCAHEPTLEMTPAADDYIIETARPCPDRRITPGLAALPAARL